MISWIFVATVFSSTVSDTVDYWDDDFDPEQNCEKSELIRLLTAEKDPGRCAAKSLGICFICVSGIAS